MFCDTCLALWIEYAMLVRYMATSGDRSAVESILLAIRIHEAAVHGIDDTASAKF